MIRLVLLLALLAAACPAPAYAQNSLNGFSDCEPLSRLPGSAGTSSVSSPGDRACFDFDAGLSPATSGLINVGSPSAWLCLDPDRNASGTSGAAVVDVQVCPSPDGAGDDTCLDTGLTLSGSNPCEAFRAGGYRLEVTTLPTGTEDAQVVIRGY